MHIQECWVINRTGTDVDVVFVGYRTGKEADGVSGLIQGGYGHGCSLGGVSVYIIDGYGRGCRLGEVSGYIQDR